MPKIWKGAAAEMDTLQGWRCTVQRVVVHRPLGGGATALCCPVYIRKGGATPRKGCALATSSGAFSNPLPTKTCSFLLLFISNWFKSTPTTPPLQMCQHHHVFSTLCMCVSFSQTFYQRISSLFTTPLDPSNDAKLDHSSGTRWPICKQVCPSW
jgi:hypothetical protein